MEKFFERMRPAMSAAMLADETDASATLCEILLAGPPKLDYLVAHSKGSLVVAHALQRFVEDPEGDESPLFERLRITTLGTVVGLPPAFKKVKQYLGAIDWFGGANSSLGVMHERVPEAGHHLNTGVPYHMNVAALLNGGAAPRLLPKPSTADVFAPLSVPPVAAAPEPMAAVKPKEAARSAAKKAATPPSPGPKAASVAPKVASAAPKVASPAPKASAAPKSASPAAKVASPTPKPPVGEAKQTSVAAKPMPKKLAAMPREPVPAAKAKTVAANGKLVVKKSKKAR
jgi:hypothetical protein